MNAIDKLSALLFRNESHGDINPANHQYAIFGFNFSGYIRSQTSATRIDMTRLQRASKGAEHSTRGGRDHVVNRGRMRLRKLSWVDFVVLGDGAVYAEGHRL